MLFYVTLSHTEYRYHPEEGGYYAPDFIVDDSNEWYYPNTAKQDFGGCLVDMLKDGWTMKHSFNLAVHVSNWIKWNEQENDFNLSMPYVTLSREGFEDATLSITIAPQYTKLHYYC